MASEEQSNNKRRRRRPPIAGALVFLVVGIAVALPLMMDSGCSPRRGGGVASTEPMELSGRWLGMTLASPDSATARGLGIPTTVAGVVIAEVTRDTASRVAQVGLAPGDVIVRVDGTTTQNLAELYTLTTRLTTARPLPIEILRLGQPMTVTVPPPLDFGVQQPMALQQRPGMVPAAPQQQQPGMMPAAPQQPTAWGQPLAATPQGLPQPIAPQPVAPQPIAQAPAAPAAQPAPPTANAGLWPAAPAPVPFGRGASGGVP